MLLAVCMIFWEPGFLYLSEKNVEGEIGADNLFNVVAIHKLIILAIACLALIGCRPYRRLVRSISSFLPFIAWMCLITVIKGPDLAKVKSLLSVLAPILFGAACGFHFDLVEGFTHIRKAVVGGLIVGLMYGLAANMLFPIYDRTECLLDRGVLKYLFVYNTLAMSALSIMCVSLMCCNDSTLRRTRHKLVVLGALVVPILTVGRLYVFAEVVACTFLLSYVATGLQRRMIVRLALPCAVVIGALTFSMYYMKTFGDSGVGGGAFETGGRIERTWPEYLEYARQDLLLGHGPGMDVQYKLTSGLHIAGCCHCDYLALTIYGGIPALLLYIYGVGVWIRDALRLVRRQPETRAMVYASMVPVLFFGICAIAANPLRSPWVMIAAFSLLGIVRGQYIRTASTCARGEVL